MKKRFLALAIAGAMTMALAGCTSKQAASAEGSATETQAKAEADTKKEAEGASAAEGDASKSSWPSGTVQLYVPASAGGGTDMIARVFAKGMSDATGANFVVINDATGGGTVALETVRNSKPDALNLYLGHTGQCGMMATGQYNYTYDDFQMLGTITVPGTETNCIVVNKNVEANTLEEFIEAAKISETMKTVLEKQDIIAQYHQMQMEAGYNTPDEAEQIVSGMQEKYNEAASLMK